MSILVSLCTDATAPVKVRIMSFSVIHSTVLFPSWATQSPVADDLLHIAAIDGAPQLSREQGTLLLSRLLSRFVGRLHTVSVSHAL